MTDYDDPNREAVGLDPIWMETGDNVPDPPPPEGGEGEGEGTPLVFDPGAHTVVEVEEYLDAHPEDSARVLHAERAGRGRVSLLGDA